MLVAATTLKDSLANVERFVAGNLGGGLDHLVVFLDAPRDEGQQEVGEFLDAEQHVTCVRAGPAWWDERPRALNERQCTNATVVKELLAVHPGSEATWAFHVDGDEVVRLDRAVLASVPEEAPTVQLAVREAVSQAHWESPPTLFKRELDDHELQVLHERGLLARPSNRDYFNGHLQGKVGVRVRVAGWIGLHRVLDSERTALPAHRDPRLELFHYESYSAEEFLRKWTAMVASGPRASYRPGRLEHAERLRDLITADLPDEERRRRLLEVYRATTEDDVGALSRARGPAPHRPAPGHAGARVGRVDGDGAARGPRAAAGELEEAVLRRRPRGGARAGGVVVRAAAEPGPPTPATARTSMTPGRAGPARSGASAART